MNFKLLETTENYITVSVENDGFVIVADFSRKMFKEKGYIDAENVRLLNSETPENAAKFLSSMMQKLGDWVVKEHSNLLNNHL